MSDIKINWEAVEETALQLAAHDAAIDIDDEIRRDWPWGWKEADVAKWRELAYAAVAGATILREFERREAEAPPASRLPIYPLGTIEDKR